MKAILLHNIKEKVANNATFFITTSLIVSKVVSKISMNTKIININQYFKSKMSGLHHSHHHSNLS